MLLLGVVLQCEGDPKGGDVVVFSDLDLDFDAAADATRLLGRTTTADVARAGAARVARAVATAPTLLLIAIMVACARCGARGEMKRN